MMAAHSAAATSAAAEADPQTYAEAMARGGRVEEGGRGGGGKPGEAQGVQEGAKELSQGEPYEVAPRL